MTIYDFKVENRETGSFVNVPHPHFSWKLQSEEKNVLQRAYALEVFSDGTLIWSDHQKSDKSIHVRYKGDALLPRTMYKVHLLVEDNHGNRAESSLSFETDKLGELFSAKFISAGDTGLPVYRLTKSVTLLKKVKKARLYASALGLYEFYCGEAKVGDCYFAPFWTDYRHTLEYQTYDITELLHVGENRLSMLIGKGWYAGALGFAGERANYGNRTAGLAELYIVYEDGTEEVIATDESWQAESCCIQDSEFYYGETQDFTAETKKCGVVVLPFDLSLLTGQKNEPVRCTETLPARNVIRTPKGEYVLDFGQNLAGFIRLEVEGKRGDTITVRHAEVLDREGNFYTENLRRAVSVDTYVLAGGKQVLKPHFTSHGFRYIQIIGAEIPAENCIAQVIHSDMVRTGHFTCSDERLNRLQSNIVWGQRGNFIDVPTDCPQRDERLGWTADANVFFRTAAFNYDVSNFFGKWLDDLRSEQSAEGSVPHVIPNTMGTNEGAALWSDAATMIPWNKFLVDGNTDALERQFGSMKAWVDYIASKCGKNGLWQSGFQYGDWLALDSGNTVSRTGVSDKYLVANIFYFVSVTYVVNAARALGKEELYQEYRTKRSALLRAIRHEYFTATGRLVSETQTVCALALYFGIAPKKFEKQVLAALVNNLAENANHLNTGFAGTPYLLFALSDFGKQEIATKLLFNDDYPSWLYEVNHGATTVWERWNGILPDGSLYDPGMNSFNHYAYGSVGDFLYRRVAGLDCAVPGYKKIVIKPKLTKGLETVRAEYESAYGKIVSAYECRNGKIKVSVEIPCNTTATVYLPEQEKPLGLGSGVYEFEYATNTDLSVKRFHMECKFGALLELEKGQEVIESFIPGVSSGPMFEFARDMTLTEVAAYSGEEGVRLFTAIIDRLNELDARGEI